MLPVIIIPGTLIISNISITEIPLWAIIMLSILILLSPLTFFLSQRFAEGASDTAPLQKQKKTLWTAFGVCTILFAIIIITSYYVTSKFSWTLLFFPIGVLPFTIVRIIRLYFPKEKKPTEYDE